MKLPPLPADVYWCRAPRAGWQDAGAPREWQVWRPNAHGLTKLAQHPSLKEAKRRARERLLNPLGWRGHASHSVVGCIDAHGVITARACPHMDTHRPEEMRGKRWRWMVHSQEFHALAPRSTAELNDRMLMALTKDESFAVADWLVRKGFADDILLRSN